MLARVAVPTILLAIFASVVDPRPASAGEGFSRYLEQQVKGRLQARRVDARKAEERAARARVMARRRAQVAAAGRAPVSPK